MTPRSRKPDYKVNLIRQHQLCERNFLQLMQLLPDLRTKDEMSMAVAFIPEQIASIHFEVKQRAVYTTHLRIYCQAEWGNWLSLPELEVRLYHDVEMAEVIFSKTSERLDPLYKYPNPKMYLPNEKEQWNQFLAELLDYCLQGGMTTDPIPSSFSP